MDIQVINNHKYVKVDECFIPYDLVQEKPTVTSPSDIFPFVSEYRTKKQEYFILLTLDGSNRLVEKHEITKGLANKSLVHPREVFKPAILDNACHIVLVHNHPSGSLAISKADMATTERLVEASKIMGIPVLDHIIVSVEGSVSIREENPECFL